LTKKNSRRKLQRERNRDRTATYREISDTIKLKGNKAPGIDNIPAELIKHGGYTLKNRMYKLILLIWNKEQLPTEWLQGICPIYKKGE
jgi:hypothetical protein